VYCVVLLCYGLLSHFLLNGMKCNSPAFPRKKLCNLHACNGKANGHCRSKWIMPIANATIKMDRILFYAHIL
jgi:hypothetical protein